MVAVVDLYDAAERAGLLIPVKVGAVTVACAFRAPDETVLDGLALSREYRIEFPVSRVTLQSGDTVEIGGSLFRVREVRQMGDGSEVWASLTRL